MSILGAIAGSAAGSALSGAFNAASSRKQMKFQERMANTQYQRAAADLDAAGLNRILALGNPAASPSGAGFSVPDFGAGGVAAYSAKSAARRSGAQAAIAEGTVDSSIKRAEAEAETAEVQTEIARALLEQETAKATPARGINQAVEKLPTAIGDAVDLVKSEAPAIKQKVVHSAKQARDSASMAIGDTVDWLKGLGTRLMTNARKNIPGVTRGTRPAPRGISRSGRK